MSRRSAPSTSLPARVRQWFGLTQAELALYLGSSQTLLQAIETGQRRLRPELAGLLLPLAAHLPPLLPPRADARPALPRLGHSPGHAARLGTGLL